MSGNAKSPGARRGAVLMVQGTGSSVGKSLLVAALCRIFRQDGHSVAPFKAQNMSLNSGVTPSGHEIGRSTIVQAESAGILPSVDMNPILLKPEADHRSQLVLNGRPAGHIEAHHFNARWADMWGAVTAALARLRSEHGVVVIEGAGSPAEINLRGGDIVNMEVALHANAPVLLVGDIDKGGVFAQLYGTLELIAPEEKALVAGMVINKFRGDVKVLQPGLVTLKELTGKPVFGVVPYVRDLRIAEEDSPSGQPTAAPNSLVDIAVIALPHIANFDDFDPLKREPGVGLRYVRRLEELGAPDLVIVPGTKTTVADLRHLRESGLADALVGLAASGTALLGICGGFQMLGRSILDPSGVESTSRETEGLRLLPVTTVFQAAKETRLVTGRALASPRGLFEHAEGMAVSGYEIHMGSSTLLGDGSPVQAGLFELPQRRDGIASADGWVAGTYLHGLFNSAELRRRMVMNLAIRKGVKLPDAEGATFDQSAEYDRLADEVRAALDMEAVYGLL
jgi:adenosylcobyric acid synthase